LFATVSTTYGVGDGSTTFNLPDLRGRAIFGKDNMGGSAANRITSAGSGVDGTVLGASGGTQNVTLTTNELPAHTHTITDPGHTHSLTDGDNVMSSAGPVAFGGIGGNMEVTTIASATTGITGTNSAGLGNAVSKLNPTLILNYIIKY
jgi:microcystin-dependent protein